MFMLHNFYVVVLLMGLAVYVCRSSGYWLAGRVEIGPRLRAWLGYLPGCIMISIVVPLLKTATIFEWMGAALTIIIMIKCDHLLLAMCSGMLLVALLRLTGWGM